MKKTLTTGFILSFFLAVLSFNTMAQEYTYDLNKYFTPDIVRNSLDLSFNTNNNFNNSSYKTDTARITYSTHLSGAVTPNFVNYTNTRKRLSLFQVYGQFNGSYSTSGLINESYPYKNFQTVDDLTINYSNHFYNAKNQFLSVGIYSNFQMTVYNSGNEANSSKTTYNNNYLSIAPTVGIGIGRIESVEDARQAIYILDDLSKKGILTRQLNDDEIFQFAQQISRVKNKRFLDARLHLIDEITTVDSILVSNNLLNKSDARYFTSLYDNWQYGALFSRKSGQSFEITFTPSYNWNYINYNPWDTINRNWKNQNNITGNLSLTYTYEKPVNLNWQHSVSVSLNGSTHFSNYLSQYGNLNYPYVSGNVGSLNSYDSRSVNLNGFYRLGFYPSTRTHLSASLNQNTRILYTKDFNNNSASWEKTLDSYTSLYFTADYYLSQQLRLSLGANLGNNFINHYYSAVKNSQLFAGFGGTLSYSFF